MGVACVGLLLLGERLAEKPRVLLSAERSRIRADGSIPGDQVVLRPLRRSDQGCVADGGILPDREELAAFLDDPAGALADVPLGVSFEAS